jgi:chorismate mutase
MPGVIRILMLANLDRAQKRVKHVYLGKAAGLRKDIATRGR